MASSRRLVTDSEKQVIRSDDMQQKWYQPPSNRRASLVKACIVTVIALLGLYIYLPGLDLASYFTPCAFQRQSVVGEDASLGAVASESAACSAAGIEMLKKGGNAADAMVATVFCVGVIGMYHSGIGGGGFMLIRSPDGTFESVDFRETAPAAAFQDMYTNDTKASIEGGLASGVPSEIRGLEYLHENYGVLPWSTVLQPAIKTARYGFPMTEDLMRAVRSTVKGGKTFLVEDPSWALDFAPNGTLLNLEDTVYRKRYADTLETIANEGPDAFYTGYIAETMIKAVQDANGTMTLQDLENYGVVVGDTPQIDYRGYKVTSTSAPSAGSIGLSILRIVEGYEDFFSPDSIALSTHRLDEAMRFGYGQRTTFGDPAFVEGLYQREQDILNDTTVEGIRRRISDLRTQNISAYDPDGLESLDTPGTSHISTADRSGLAVTLTTTINLFFGSLLMVPETGIIMNNEMNDFSIPGSSNEFGFVPSPSNYIRPGKRPLSSITPMIVTHPDGSLYFVTGAAGGSRITTATVQSVINVIDRGMDPFGALAEPRLHDQLIPNRVTFEYSFNNDTVKSMQTRGHNVTWVGPGQSSAQSVRLLPNGTFEAAGEPRQKNSGGYAI
ncbi:gamma-glutamyltranspeptidase [Talaromyces proteolyticus]|uniref:Glutathione hydrolase n=1 Tax=Talaromyces proteolyticus TaxID=1131652 RepID=A0AAD4PZU0_9EURO|nr:gamma-glutamyltranspeptidase [Talaromyces proteolyticus]KAH8703368.1 gamma-glutamyltranspeptidase [Talaromyces proteolyticus]